MKKSLITILLLLSVAFVYGQKIKIKDELVSVDKQEYAKCIAETYVLFTFSTLDNKVFAEAKYFTFNDPTHISETNKTGERSYYKVVFNEIEGAHYETTSLYGTAKPFIKEFFDANILEGNKLNIDNAKKLINEKGTIYSDRIEKNRTEKEVADNKVKIQESELIRLKESNIENEKGYIVNNLGEKTEGYVFLKFHIDPTTQKNGVIDVDASKLGKQGSIKYINNKGKNKTISFKSKDNIIVHVQSEDGKESVYEGINITGNLLEAPTLSITDNSGFLKLEGNEGYINYYLEVITGNTIIKIKDFSKGYRLGENEINKDFSKLKKYLGEKSDDFDFSKYDFKKKEDIIQMIKELNNFYK